MGSRCGDCGVAFNRSRRPVETVTGRQVCPSCAGSITAAAAGVIAAGDAASTGEVISGAVATEGWFRRLLSRRGAGRR